MSPVCRPADNLGQMRSKAEGRWQPTIASASSAERQASSWPRSPARPPPWPVSQLSAGRSCHAWPELRRCAPPRLSAWRRHERGLRLDCRPPLSPPGNANPIASRACTQRSPRRALCLLWSGQPVTAAGTTWGISGMRCCLPPCLALQPRSRSRPRSDPATLHPAPAQHSPTPL